MKYKNLIVTLTVFATIFWIHSNAEINAQARHGKRQKAVQRPKSKAVISKSAKPKIVINEAMVIGSNNPVLKNPTTTAVSNPNAKTHPKQISLGIINGKAVNLVKPLYPQAAKAVRASGAINVLVTLDEEGNVISANANSGHPLLRSTAEQAARASKFSPSRLNGQPVRVSGVIVYNFVAQ